MRTCRICKESKSLDRFASYKTRAGNVYTYTRCKDCRNSVIREGRTQSCSICGKKYSGLARELCDEHYEIYRYAYSLYHNAVYRSKKAGKLCNLTVEWIYQRLSTPCPRTGLTFMFGNNGRGFKDRNPRAASLDKIDPSKGYTVDNVQVVCWWYNCSKQRFSDEEVINLCKAVTHQATMSRKSPAQVAARKTT